MVRTWHIRSGVHSPCSPMLSQGWVSQIQFLAPQWGKRRCWGSRTGEAMVRHLSWEVECPCPSHSPSWERVPNQSWNPLRQDFRRSGQRPVLNHSQEEGGFASHSQSPGRSVSQLHRFFLVDKPWNNAILCDTFRLPLWCHGEVLRWGFNSPHCAKSGKMWLCQCLRFSISYGSRLFPSGPQQACWEDGRSAREASWWVEALHWFSVDHRVSLSKWIVPGIRGGHFITSQWKRLELTSGSLHIFSFLSEFGR